MNLNTEINIANQKYIELYQYNEEVINVVNKTINFLAMKTETLTFYSLKELYEAIFLINKKEQFVFNLFFDVNQKYTGKIILKSEYVEGDLYLLTITTNQKKEFNYSIIDTTINYIEIENEYKINEGFSYSINYSYHDDRIVRKPLSLHFKFTDIQKETCCRVKQHPEFKIYCMDKNNKSFYGVNAFDGRVENSKIKIGLSFTNSISKMIKHQKFNLYFDFLECIENKSIFNLYESHNFNAEVVLLDFASNNKDFMNFIETNCRFITLKHM